MGAAIQVETVAEFVQTGRPCLFFRNEVVLVVYVDDCLIFSPKKERTDEVVKELAEKFT